MQSKSTYSFSKQEIEITQLKINSFRRVNVHHVAAFPRQADSLHSTIRQCVVQYIRRTTESFLFRPCIRLIRILIAAQGNSWSKTKSTPANNSANVQNIRDFPHCPHFFASFPLLCRSIADSDFYYSAKKIEFPYIFWFILYISYSLY